MHPVSLPCTYSQVLGVTGETGCGAGVADSSRNAVSENASFGGLGCVHCPPCKASVQVLRTSSLQRGDGQRPGPRGAPRLDKNLCRTQHDLAHTVRVLSRPGRSPVAIRKPVLSLVARQCRFRRAYPRASSGANGEADQFQWPRDALCCGQDSLGVATAAGVTRRRRSCRRRAPCRRRRAPAPGPA